MSDCTPPHRVVTSPISIGLSIIRIQTAIFKLSSEVPQTEQFKHFHNCLVDASIALASCDLFLKIPDND